MKKIKIPFTLDEYNKGNYEVVTGNGDKVRIICDDRKGEYPIIGLVVLSDQSEAVFDYTKKGIANLDYPDNEHVNLFLIKDEFENGDIIVDKVVSNYFIIYRDTEHDCVVSDARFNCSSNTLRTDERVCEEVKEFRLATKEEKQKFFDALEKDGKRWNSKNKCLEDVKKEKQFKPMQWCLMHNFSDDEWVLCQFSHCYQLYGKTYYEAVEGLSYRYCIPYDEETKHLLGTTDEYKKEGQYVSFETAKLAKEVGFDLLCKRYFRNESITCKCNVPSNSNTIEGEYSQPTQTVLNDWLREKYFTKVGVYSIGSCYKSQIAGKLLKGHYNNSLYIDKPNMSYEKAYELGLQEALKLLKNEYFKQTN